MHSELDCNTQAALACQLALTIICMAAVVLAQDQLRLDQLSF